MKFVDTDILIDFYRNYQPSIDFLDYYYSMDRNTCHFFNNPNGAIYWL